MSIAQIYILNAELTAAQLRDAIMERIQQLQALTVVCQVDDFTDFKLEYVGNYFWLQNSLLNQLAELFNTYNQRLAS